MDPSASSALPPSPRLLQLAGGDLQLLGWLEQKGISSLMLFAFGIGREDAPAEFREKWDLANRSCCAEAVAVGRAIGLADLVRPQARTVALPTPWPKGPPLEQPQAKRPRGLPALLAVRDFAPVPSALSSEHGKARGLAEVLKALLSTWQHLTPLADETLPAAALQQHLCLVADSLATYSVSSLRGAISAWA